MHPLYEIEDALERVILDHTDPDTGELDEGFEAAVDALQLDKKQRVLHLGRWALGEQEEGDATKAVADRLAERAAIHYRKVARIKALLHDNMNPGIPGQIGESYKDAVVTVRAQRNAPSVSVPEDADPSLWIVDGFEEFVVVRYEANKSALKDALKAGKPVPEGVTLVPGHHVRIFT